MFDLYIGWAGGALNMRCMCGVYGLCTIDAGGVVEDTVRTVRMTGGCARLAAGQSERRAAQSIFKNGVYSSIGRVYTIRVRNTAAKARRRFFCTACQKQPALLIGPPHCNFGDAHNCFEQSSAQIFSRFYLLARFRCQHPKYALV